MAGQVPPFVRTTVLLTFDFGGFRCFFDDLHEAVFLERDGAIAIMEASRDLPGAGVAVPLLSTYGSVRDVCVSSSGRFACVLHGESDVTVFDLETKESWPAKARGRHVRVLGVAWGEPDAPATDVGSVTGGTPTPVLQASASTSTGADATSMQVLVVVSTAGLDFFTVFPGQRALKHMRNVSCTVTRAWIHRRERFVLLDTGARPGVELRGFMLFGSPLVKLPKFRVPPGECAYDDVHLAVLYGDLYVLAIDRVTCVLSVYSVTLDTINLVREFSWGSSPDASGGLDDGYVLLGSGDGVGESRVSAAGLTSAAAGCVESGGPGSASVRVSVVDSLVCIHDCEHRLSHVFDVGGGRASDRSVSVAPPSPVTGSVDIYGSDAIMMGSNFVLSPTRGALGALQIDLSAMSQLRYDSIARIEFLLRRSDRPLDSVVYFAAEPTPRSKAALLLQLRELVLDPVPLSRVRAAFAAIHAPLAHVGRLSRRNSGLPVAVAPSSVYSRSPHSRRQTTAVSVSFDTGAQRGRDDDPVLRRSKSEVRAQLRALSASPSHYTSRSVGEEIMPAGGRGGGAPVGSCPGGSSDCVRGDGVSTSTSSSLCGACGTCAHCLFPPILLASVAHSPGYASSVAPDGSTVVSQQEVFQHVLRPVGDIVMAAGDRDAPPCRAGLRPRVFCAVLVEYLRSLQRHIVRADNSVPILLVDVQVRCNMTVELQLQLQYRVLNDSRQLATRLLDEGRAHGGLRQAAHDMLLRQKMYTELVEALLEDDEVLAAYRITRDHPMEVSKSASKAFFTALVRRAERDTARGKETNIGAFYSLHSFLSMWNRTLVELPEGTVRSIRTSSLDPAAFDAVVGAIVDDMNNVASVFPADDVVAPPVLPATHMSGSPLATAVGTFPAAVFGSRAREVMELFGFVE